MGITSEQESTIKAIDEKLKEDVSQLTQDKSSSLKIVQLAIKALKEKKQVLGN